jgi:N-acetylglucosamine kinase-like BadF-type ATPase
MKCVLGIDGGGSKTECVVMNETDEIVGRATGPASNPTRIGFPAALAGVTGAAKAAIHSAGVPVEVVAMCAGLAGTGREENRIQMQKLLRQNFPGVLIEVQTDLELPLSAMPPGPAMVLVVGTGSAALGRDVVGNIHREGGFGPANSDEGSAFDIGRSAVLAARSESTPESIELTRHILRHLGIPGWAEVDSQSAIHADMIFPRIFPVVAAAADSGNTVAQSLLLSAAEKLASMTGRLADALNLREQPCPLGKVGGTVGRSRFFDQTLDRELLRMLPNIAVSPLKVDAAAVAAKKSLGLWHSQKGPLP